jgi:predicted metal-dependent hydrolase
MHSYMLIRSSRKTLCLEITRGAELLVRAPRFLTKSEIDRFVGSKAAWIEKHLEIIRQNPVTDLTDEQIDALKRKAAQILPAKTSHYAGIMGLKPSSVKITSAKKRLGSCSEKNGVCYSYRLMLYPDEAIDYVVVHELAHIKHKNHGKNFYSLIEKFMPDYRQKKALFKNSRT